MMSKQPNILLIMTDQHRGDCLSIEDHPVLMTPNMDSIAGRGASFRRCYSTCPICIPARRSLLSGQFPATHGLVHNTQIPETEWDANISMPSVLRRAGYHTYLAGRRMHQYPSKKRYGYDHMVTNRVEYEDWLADHAPARSYQQSGDYYSSGVMHNDWTARAWHLDETLHQTNWTVNEALKFLRDRDPSCPFFLTVSFLAPHPPLNPPAFYMDRYLRQELPDRLIGDWAEPLDHNGKGVSVDSHRVNLHGEALRSCRAAYYGLINHIDDQIRRFLHQTSGMDWDNTVVLYTSDHGEMLGDHYFFRKSLPYEGSARVPLLIAAPERYGIKRGQVLDQPVVLEDIMPTILDFAGAEIPETVEGKSLIPLLRGEPVSWREDVHIEHGGNETDIQHHTLTDGKEKYIWFAHSGDEQFFNLRQDPSECRNLIAEPQLQKRISGWRNRLIERLKNRPEGFTDGKQLIAGRPYPSYIGQHQNHT